MVTFALCPLSSFYLEPKKVREMRQPCYDHEVARHTLRQQSGRKHGSPGQPTSVPVGTGEKQAVTGVSRHCLGSVTCSGRMTKGHKCSPHSRTALK